MPFCCGSQDGNHEREVSKKIDAELKKQKTQNTDKRTLLILGTGESGKSTIIKQFRILYGSGFTDEYRKQMKATILGCLVEAMLNLRDAVNTLEPPIEMSNTEIEQWRSLEGQVEDLSSSVTERSQVAPELVDSIISFWDHPATQKAFARKSEFQIADCAKPFLKDAKRICAEDYVPTDQDLLYTRVRTTGVSEYTYTIGDNIWTLYDVGGQRSERKKWIPYFDGCNAIIFVADSSSFDMKMFEDANSNRMEDSLNEFKSLCNNPLLKNMPVIIFLNKIDLLKDKLELQKVQFKNFFHKYQGDNSYISVINFMLQMYEDVVLATGQNRKYHCFETWATDTSQIKKVMASVEDTIMQIALENAGLMSMS